jgi:hypothetical protein
MKSLRSTGRPQASRASRRKSGLPWKKLAVGEHGKTGGPGPLVAGGDFGGAEVLPQHALAGACLFDFGDHGGLAGRDPLPQRAHEIPRRRHEFRRKPHGLEGLAPPGGGDFLFFHGEDFLQDI